MHKLIVTILALTVLVIVSVAEEHQAAKFFEKLCDGKKQTVVVYGTSLTAGGRTKAGWPEAMQEWFDQNYSGQVRFINAARAGSTSDWGLQNLPVVLKARPDMIFIEFSVNDARQGGRPDGSASGFNMPPERSADNLRQMVDALQKQNPDVLIVLQTMNATWDANANRSYSIRKEHEKYNDLYREFAKERGLQLLDHYPNWQKLKETESKKFQAYIPDGTHPSPEGSLAVTWPVIEQWFEACSSKR